MSAAAVSTPPRDDDAVAAWLADPAALLDACGRRLLEDRAELDPEMVYALAEVDVEDHLPTP